VTLFPLTGALAPFCWGFWGTDGVKASGRRDAHRILPINPCCRMPESSDDARQDESVFEFIIVGEKACTARSLHSKARGENMFETVRV